MCSRALAAIAKIVVVAALSVSTSAFTFAQKPPSRVERQVIRDRQGRRLGEIVRLSNGKLEARDPLGRKLGAYDPKTDQTRDPLDRLLTKGNTLSALTMKAAEARQKKERAHYSK
jgi:hypothetical protein